MNFQNDFTQFVTKAVGLGNSFTMVPQTWIRNMLEESEFFLLLRNSEIVFKRELWEKIDKSGIYNDYSSDELCKMRLFIRRFQMSTRLFVKIQQDLKSMSEKVLMSYEKYALELFE